VVGVPTANCAECLPHLESTWSGIVEGGVLQLGSAQGCRGLMSRAWRVTGTSNKCWVFIGWARSRSLEQGYR
jgi:hypothetical protein